MSQEATKAKNKSKFEELNITKDEIDRFSEAMKKEEFRKLLVEYAEEISDPKNREQYEKEITALEEERGQNVVFIHPETGFCMKTTQNGSTKCFINICKNSNVEKPTSKRETRSSSQSTNGKSTQGLVWYIPHTCSPPREDYDKSGEKPCIVYDVVFNPDSYRMAETNERFKSLLKNSAMETIEKNFNVKLDRANLKILKHLNFKGRPTATILRKPQTPDSAKPTVSVPANASNEDLIKPLIDQIKQNSLDKELEKSFYLNDKNKQPLVTEITEKDSTPKNATPVYKLVHRGHTDMQDYANDLSNRYVSSTRPKELVITIELPLCKSSENVNIDIFETRLHLESKDPNYLLDLNLPFPVKEKEAKAKFDKSKRSLTVTLPVVSFVSKLDDNYFPPSPSPSNSSSSSLDSASPCETPDVHTQVASSESVTSIRNEPEINNNSIKYMLPESLILNETSKCIYVKLKCTNYVKESIQIRFDSASALSIKCESCSAHGSYIRYHSASLSFVYSNSDQPVELIDLNKNTNEAVYIDDEYFEIKLNKSEQYMKSISQQVKMDSSKQAHVLVDKHSVDKKLLIDVNQISSNDNHYEDDDDESEAINENKNNNNNNPTTENMNTLSKKEFIFSFKSNAENHSELDEDDDDDDDDDDDEDEEETLNNTNKEDMFEKIDGFKNINKFKRQIKPDTNVLADKIEEEPEIFEDAQSVTDNSIDNQIMNQETFEDCEKDYLAKSQLANNENNQELSDEEDDDDENDSKKENTEPMSLSSSSTNFSNDSSSLARRLKSILKKPRSFSESESNITAIVPQRHSISSCLRDSFNGGSSDCNSNSESLNDMTISKKSVSFNKQVIRNVFKPGSTVQGMKKPNSNKNKKKNKRKRTVSDPSSDASTAARESTEMNKLRPRNMSESSDDNSSQTNSDQLNYSEENVSDLPEDKSNNCSSQAPDNKKKKNNKKKKANTKLATANSSNSTSSIDEKKKPQPQEEVKNPLDLETMISWKNEGRLSSDNNPHKTACSFKFKNKLMEELDD